MKIFVTGTRGIPDIPGGVESHCQQLYPLIVGMNHEVMICRRNSYITEPLSEWSGIKLVDCFSPRKKSIEAIVHTFLAIIEAKKWGADIVHIHAVGPAILVPFARLLGMKVVMTNHGPDYDRQKWGKLARFILKLGEKLGGIYANEVIVISEVIRKIIKERCNRDSNLIYNGVIIPELNAKTGYITNQGLTAKNYILAVARFVPEKGLHDLINAFNQLDLDCHLVIAGDSDHKDKYSESLKELAAQNPKIMLTGYITGSKLDEIFTHAKLFVLPSYHEGLPIALLEALSYGLPSLVSDIPANKEVKLPEKNYFRCGDIADLAHQILESWNTPFTIEDMENTREFVRKKYNWETIACQTVMVYKKVMKN